jgi:histone-lysine N-methyltransferase SETD1
LLFPSYPISAFQNEVRPNKARLRPAPYKLKPFSWDPKTSVGRGPATRVVVYGFDPLTVTESKIRAMLSQFGHVSETKNMTDPSTGSFLGVCSVEFRDKPASRDGRMIKAVDAAREAEKEGSGQRIDQWQVKIERDSEGLRSRKYAQRIINHRKADMDREFRPAPRPTPNVPEPPPTTAPAPAATTVPAAPPPNAPKGPSVKPPPQGPRTILAPRPAAHSLVEQQPILASLKRKPYIFIAHCYVPVLGTTIKHLQNRMKMYDWREVRCDRTGYYIVFEDSKRGEDETQRCFKETHMEPLFTYTMNMECQKYGNPNYERSPSPARIAERDERRKTRMEDELDFETEKKERAENLDPSKAALERLLVELRDIIMADIKVKFAAPALFEYLSPDRHAATRKKLGIAEPVNTNVQRPFSLNTIDDGPSGHPDYTGGYRKSFGRFDRNRQRHDVRSAFSDERRRRNAPRLVQPLHKRLQDFFDSDESDDERRTTFTKGSDGLDSRAISEAAKSPARFDPDEDDKKRRRGDAGWGADSDDEGLDSMARKTLGHLLHKEPEDMATAELEQILSALPRSSKLRKRAMTEVKLRRKALADDQLFFSEENERKASASVVDIKVEDTESAVATPEPEVVAKTSKKKAAKPKKRTKKQLQEQEAAERAEAEAKLDKFIEQDEAEEPAPGTVQDLVPEESTPEVEWGVSTTEPRRTVQDDWRIVMDLDGWQQFVKDDEDLKFLRLSLQSVAPLDLGDADLWAWNEKQFKALNRDGLYGIAYDTVSIPGYYVPNSTGSARTEGYRKIKESEKSMYLPHRIKVQNLRKERQAQAKKNKTSTPEPAGKAQKMSSRTNRAEHRRLQNDLLTSKQAFGMDTDAVRFNQLKKRKKFVRFDRSSIHGWGLYAEENISMGDMIIEYVGEKVRQRVADMREVMYTKQGIGSSYLFRIDDDMVIDATKKGGIARFINHSCMPNCTAKIIKVDGTKRIVIYALRDIVKGMVHWPSRDALLTATDEELTYDYKFEREINSDDRIPCLCGTVACKGFLN